MQNQICWKPKTQTSRVRSTRYNNIVEKKKNKKHRKPASIQYKMSAFSKYRWSLSILLDVSFVDFSGKMQVQIYANGYS